MGSIAVDKANPKTGREIKAFLEGLSQVDWANWNLNNPDKWRMLWIQVRREGDARPWKELLGEALVIYGTDADDLEEQAAAEVETRWNNSRVSEVRSEWI